MKKYVLSLILLSLTSIPSYAQFQSNWFGGNGTMPSGTSLPSACATGQTFLLTNASSGQNIYTCIAGSWVQQGLSGSGGGTVTTASVVSANGLAGTVANPTTSPAITLSTTVTGVLKGNGTTISSATSGTDYAPATSGSSILKGNSSGGFSNAVSSTDYAPATTGSSILKANSGGFANAVSGTDYAPATTGSSILKANSGGFTNAVSGTDYAPATSGTSLLKGNGSGGFANAAGGIDYTPATTGSNYELLASNGSGGITNITLGSGLTNTLGTLSSTGAVSTVSNSDGSLTISPTSGAVVGSVNVAHSNTWTGGQIFNTVSPIVGTATASTPTIYNASKALVSGSYVGNTTSFQMNNGALTSGNLVKSDASQNVVDAGVSIGTITNGKVCIATSGTAFACTASASGTGTVTSIGANSPNSTILVTSSPVTTSGTIGYDVNWTDINMISAINSGGINWSNIVNGVLNSTGINWNNINGLKPINVGGINWLSISSYLTGNVLTATTNGGVNWTPASAGNGTVTSVTAIAPLLSSGGTTPGISVNWQSLNLLGDINMGGINWYSAASLNQGINWYNVGLISNTLTTTSSGVGNIKLYDSTGTNWNDISAVSSIPASWTLTLPANPGTNGQFLKTDGTGISSWGTVSGSGTVNSGTSGQIGYYASSTNAISSLTDATYSTSTGLEISQNYAGPYGFVAVNNNANGLAVNDVQDVTTGNFGGEVQTGSSYAIPNVFAIGTFVSEPIDILMNQSPIAQFDTGGDLGVGITNTSYYNYETGQQMIDVNNQEFQGNFVSTVSAYGGGISIGQDTGSAVVNGARIGKIEFSGPTDGTGFNGNAYSSAGIAAYATQNWSGSATGSQLVLQTTPNSSTTRTTVLTLGQSGSMTLANASSAAVGHATCWTTGGQIGYCTAGSSIVATGACTCTGL